VVDSNFVCSITARCADQRAYYQVSITQRPKECQEQISQIVHMAGRIYKPVGIKVDISIFTLSGLLMPTFRTNSLLLNSPPMRPPKRGSQLARP
jgi:hypothetical protein